MLQNTPLETSKWLATQPKTTSQLASGSRISIEQHIPFFAGCPQSWRSGLAIIMETHWVFRRGIMRMGELNSILGNNLVPGTNGHLRTFGAIQWECGTNGHLRTFGAIQWECKLFNGRPKARCYPFDLPKHRFRGRTLKVCDLCTDIVCGMYI